jgi:peroxiredoxin Q/BCP
MLQVGERAPDFELEGIDGVGGAARTYSLAEFAGTPVVLVFYPADNSPVCTVQLRSYTDDIGAFAAVGARVLALSPQSIGDHAQFAEQNGGFAFPLLADVDKDVARTYEILGPLGFYRRSVFVIDVAGIVRWARRSTAGLTFRPVSEIVEAVGSLEI